MICGLLTGVTSAGERAKPFLIGALTDSWGPTPTMLGLRDGLQELGYRENEQFIKGTIRQRWLTDGGEDVIFPSESILQAVQEIAGKR